MRYVKHWLSDHWVAGALFMALALLLLLPALVGTWATSVLLIFLHSPAYMLHQVEEHAGDRFRTFINSRLFGGAEALTTDTVLWVNLPGVWSINLAALYAARLIEPGFGLAAPYLVLVNAAVHIATTAVTHGYNPGLWSSLLVFLPLGIVTLAIVEASPLQHALGLTVAVVGHVAIAARIHTRAAKLKGT